jgi:general secretion pathway protein E
MPGDLSDRLRGLIKGGSETAPASEETVPAAKAQAEKPPTTKSPIPAGDKQGADNSSAQSAATALRAEDDRNMAMGGAAITFSGQLLTADNGPLKIPQESRNLCALFDNGMWLVSVTHRNSPLVTSVAQSARRQGYKVGEPRYVTPNIIQNAYQYAEKQVALTRLDDNSVRRRIVETIQKAVELGTNDIHIEASGGRTKVEFRIDGALRQWETWTQREGEQVLSAVYSHSIGQSGATANWLEPQAAMLTTGGGQDTIQLPEGILSVRCQWVPLADGGRYLDMRLQYDSAHLFGENFVMADVDSLGFSQEQLRVVQSLRTVPGGMRIFSGPVNQGKTTTLRVMLNRRMAETNFQLNCLMIEDPPEGGVVGARQIGVSASVKDEQREKSFMEIMRCALRLDPDIVMLGETRDLQTAKFSFRLALTGRQVYTTLHVYSALAVPQRLRDLGIEPYLVYDHQLVRGMICQRLLKGMCPHCRIPLMQSPQELGPEYYEVIRRVRAGLALMDATRSRINSDKPPMERLQNPDLSQVFVANPEGCKHCYKGRVGRTVCVEVIETDARLMELLSENNMAAAEEYWLAPHGMNGVTMLWHALEKIRRGDVSPADAEFEVGPLAREKDIQDVEQKLGVLS